MSKAEEAALKAYPPKFTSGKRYAKRVQSEKVDTHAPIRKIYLKGYEQAEKDFALTWKDIMVICEHYVDVNYEYDYHSIQEKYEEILRRFKEAKQ